MTEKKQRLTGGDLSRRIDIVKTRETAYAQWAARRARRTVNDLLIAYLPYAFVLMALIFYFLSASHTVSMIQMIVPTFWAKASPIAFELGVVIIAALQQKQGRTLQTSALLWVLLLMSILINISGGFLAVLDFAITNGAKARIAGATIPELLGQFGNLPAAYQVVFPLAILLGIVIPFVGKYSGETVIKLATGEIVLERESIEDAWNRDGYNELKSALFQAALKEGAGQDVAGAWARRVTFNLLADSGPQTSTPADAVGQVVATGTNYPAHPMPARAEMGFAAMVGQGQGQGLSPNASPVPMGGLIVDGPAPFDGTGTGTGTQSRPHGSPKLTRAVALAWIKDNPDQVTEIMTAAGGRKRAGAVELAAAAGFAGSGKTFERALDDAQFYQNTYPYESKD